MNTEGYDQRTIGLWGATSVGVGAIVGGGILALAGVAFATTGPSAILAFAINGFVALLTALTFAEMSSAFPESGGTYTFAKRVLSVEAAFVVGWVVWFASIVAAVLYAIGFGYFASVTLHDVLSAVGHGDELWIGPETLALVLAITATLIFAGGLTRRSANSGQSINISKVIVFLALIVAGLTSVARRTPGDLVDSLSPFFTAGGLGLLQAMGYTFIALQGFDLIAAVAGEIREPERTIPRAMLYSLGIALGIYLPLLFIVATVGVAPGSTVSDVATSNPETVIALAAQNYLGSFGYWLVMVAAILSMLSGLQANLFAASRVAAAMAGDHTLPSNLSILHPRRRTPTRAIQATTLIIVLILLAIPNVATAGAASSLIFLITFALAHWISILMRARSSIQARHGSFRSPLFPVVPIAGALACVALAVFQGISVPSAGYVASLWLAIGGVLFLSLFAQRARVVDASTEARDPELARLRGRSPLVLVPIANPENAKSMVAVASALAPREAGRVMLLTVVEAVPGWRPSDDPTRLKDVQTVIGKSLSAALESDSLPQALTTVAADPWMEIVRVARLHRCESVLLGLTHVSAQDLTMDGSPLDRMMGAFDCNVVVLRAPRGWQLEQVRRILVPVGGRGGHDALRARLLGSLLRTASRDVTYLRALASNTPSRDLERARRDALRIASDETHGIGQLEMIESDDVVQSVVDFSSESDLVILGLQRQNRQKKTFGAVTLEVAKRSECPLLIIGRRG